MFFVIFPFESHIGLSLPIIRTICFLRKERESLKTDRNFGINRMISSIYIFVPCAISVIHTLSRSINCFFIGSSKCFIEYKYCLIFALNPFCNRIYGR
nr:MAG TPA: hypothetical protein [Caudoviricetes sp.]